MPKHLANSDLPDLIDTFGPYLHFGAELASLGTVWHELHTQINAHIAGNNLQLRGAPMSHAILDPPPFH